MTRIRRVRAQRYVAAFREGGSVPALMETDDDGMYVVKLRGAAQGGKALIAEVIGGEIARGLGLLVPDLAIVDIDEAMVGAEPDPELALPLEASVGENVGLDFLPGSLTYDVAVDPQPSAEIASLIVLFDALVMNVDRTVRNPNLLQWHGRLWLIDHGAALYPHHGWGPGDVLGDANDPFAEVSSHVLLSMATELESAVRTVKDTLSETFIAAVCAHIPAAWLDAGSRFPDAEAHRQAYEAFVGARVSVIDRLAEEADRARSV